MLSAKSTALQLGPDRGMSPASARNPQQDLAETTSPGQRSPSALSNLIEPTSLSRPIGQ